MEEFIKQITLEAGKAVLKEYGKIGHKYTKENIADVVTEADLTASKIIIGAIKEKYPDHGIISEEEDDHNIDAEYTWIIDPLDGSRNFSTRTPLFGVMVALAHKDELQLAAIYDPIQDELFFAQTNKGAFRNGERIHCSDKKDWKHSYGCCGANLSSPERRIRLANLVNYAAKEPFWLNQFGSVCISAAYIADGRRDWYFSPGKTPWDYAPAALLLEKAGCIVTDLEGKPWKIGSLGLVAANKYLHPKLLEIINAT